MANKKKIPEGITILNLSELPFGSMIEINGHEYKFNGYVKRKTKFGNQQHFLFNCENPKHERIFERFSYSLVKIKKNDEKYKW